MSTGKRDPACRKRTLDFWLVREHPLVPDLSEFFVDLKAGGAGAPRPAILPARVQSLEMPEEALAVVEPRRKWPAFNPMPIRVHVEVIRNPFATRIEAPFAGRPAARLRISKGKVPVRAL